MLLTREELEAKITALDERVRQAVEESATAQQRVKDLQNVREETKEQLIDLLRAQLG